MTDTTSLRNALRPMQPSTRTDYLVAITVVAVATGAMLIVRDHLGALNVMLIYLLVVLALGMTTGSGPAAAMAIASFVLFDFMFLPPYYTLTIADPDHVLTVFVYLGVAIVTSQLVARVRARTLLAEREQRRTALLYELNAALISDGTVPEILNTIVEQVVQAYGATGCRILLPDAGSKGLVARAHAPADLNPELDRQMEAVAERALVTRTPAGLSRSGTRLHVPHGARPESVVRARAPKDVLYVPIIAAEEPIGVMEVHGRSRTRWPEHDQEQVLISFANQAALAIERGRATETASRAAALAESDRLKSALLAAVSHDLRTPLAVIKTASSSLLDTGVSWTADEQHAFVDAIDEETDRLTLMVSNLLDLSRIEGGVLRPDLEWYDVPELVADVVERLNARGSASNHTFEAEVAPDLPLVLIDYVEIAQVLMNLGENAIKYAGPNQTSHIKASRAGDEIIFAVADSGPGIPFSDRAHVFETFYRSARDQRKPGSGIGLAISKGLVEAHGGRIWIDDKADGGSVFKIALPIAPEEGEPNGG